MAKSKKQRESNANDPDKLPTGRKDSGVGEQGSGGGYVDGIGGTSGAGSVRAKPSHIGDVSGIPAESTDDQPMPGSTGKGGEEAHHGNANTGLRGKLKGTNTDSE